MLQFSIAIMQPAVPKVLGLGFRNLGFRDLGLRDLRFFRLWGLGFRRHAITPTLENQLEKKTK